MGKPYSRNVSCSAAAVQGLRVLDDDRLRIKHDFPVRAVGSARIGSHYQDLALDEVASAGGFDEASLVFG